jgi:hypothetical protein
MRGTRIEKEVEIYATNLANKTKCMSTNAFYLRFYLISTHVLASSQFLLHVFLLSPSELTWSQVIKEL